MIILQFVLGDALVFFTFVKKEKKMELSK